MLVCGRRRGFLRECRTIVGVALTAVAPRVSEAGLRQENRWRMAKRGGRAFFYSLRFVRNIARIAVSRFRDWPAQVYAFALAPDEFLEVMVRELLAEDFHSAHFRFPKRAMTHAA
jgi:hypothetical protein